MHYVGTDYGYTVVPFLSTIGMIYVIRRKITYEYNGFTEKKVSCLTALWKCLQPSSEHIFQFLNIFLRGITRNMHFSHDYCTVVWEGNSLLKSYKNKGHLQK